MSEFINNNQTKRKEAIKEALKQIHAGVPYEEVHSLFAEVLQNASSQEIADIEEVLISEGLPVEDIQYLCDVHVALFRESLDQQAAPEMMPGHPVYTFRAENELANLVLNEVRKQVEKFYGNPDKEEKEKLLEQLKKLREYDRHYERKENLLFPYLEKYGFTGPSSVMWGIHDDVRKAWKWMIKALSSANGNLNETAKLVKEKFVPMENMIREMFYKEDRILFPNALERMSEEDWLAVYSQEEEFGFSFVERGKEWQGEEKTNTAPLRDKIKENEEERKKMTNLPLDTGDLTIQQINLMLARLPVDITFVDENDTVRYYSDTPERVFKRTPAIIGRKVQNCHPPASVDKVVEIVEDFRSGKRDLAEFWIQLNERLIYIRYFPLRDSEGNYRGTIEVSQDVTNIRKLEGEKRLLDS